MRRIVVTRDERFERDESDDERAEGMEDGVGEQ
jgi:hypothetical protein